MTKEERLQEAKRLVAKYPNELNRLLNSKFTIKSVSPKFDSWVVRDMKNEITVASDFNTFEDALRWLADDMGLI